jgi:DNA gyrase subunit A
LTDGKSAVVLSTRGGKAICFREEDIRSMGRAAAGVKGITLKKDQVVAMDTISSDRSEVLMTVTENGYGKRTPASEYNLQSRGGQGTTTIGTSAKRNVVAVLKVKDSDRLMLITNTGRLIMFNVSEVSVHHRRAQGVRLMRLELDEVVKDVALLPAQDEAVVEPTGVSSAPTYKPPAATQSLDLDDSSSEAYEDDDSDEPVD